jgi:phosphoribosylformimino-5-aminoimidazole carboxamide ribotide isomerase
VDAVSAADRAPRAAVAPDAFEVIPAIDLRGGRVVRLAQGDYARETDFQADPVELALAYEAAGARWLHLVDLDAARDGGYALQPVLRALRQRTALRLQTGGGVRDEATVHDLLSLGVERVVVGTVAVREPARVARWLERHGPHRITLALDARQDASGAWQLPVSGWTADSGRDLDALLRGYADAGLQHVLCTDIARDGMLSGFNLALYRALARDWPALRVQASGGVRDAADVAAARDAGASAAILGRALLEGRLDLAEALAC